MSEFWNGFVLGTILPGLAALLGWVKWLHEIREKRRERKSKDIAEAELAMIRRRGSAPYLTTSMVRFNNLYIESDTPNQVSFVSPTMGRLLCYAAQRVKAELPIGTPVYLVIENLNAAAPRVKLTLDGQPIMIGREADLNDAKGLTYLRYPYEPAKHGQTQIMELWFESTSGFQDTHRYELVHGERSLKRIDPS